MCYMLHLPLNHTHTNTPSKVYVHVFFHTCQRCHANTREQNTGLLVSSQGLDWGLPLARSWIMMENWSHVDNFFMRTSKCGAANVSSLRAVWAFLQLWLPYPWSWRSSLWVGWTAIGAFSADPHNRASTPGKSISKRIGALERTAECELRS